MPAISSSFRRVILHLPTGIGITAVVRRRDKDAGLSVQGAWMQDPNQSSAKLTDQNFHRLDNRCRMRSPGTSERAAFPEPLLGVNSLPIHPAPRQEEGQDKQNGGNCHPEPPPRWRSRESPDPARRAPRRNSPAAQGCRGREVRGAIAIARVTPRRAQRKRRAPHPRTIIEQERAGAGKDLISAGHIYKDLAVLHPGGVGRDRAGGGKSQRRAAADVEDRTVPLAGDGAIVRV